MAKEITDFFQTKKQRSDTESAGIDWAKRRDDWKAAINLLYVEIEQWMKPLVDSNTVVFSRKAKQIQEAHLGSYSVDELILSVGDESVIFSPRARNVVGAQGRVDVRGEAGEAIFIVQPGPRWSVVVSRTPILKTESLDLESFNEIIQAVMRQ